MRKVIIKNMFGEVELSSDKRQETMATLVSNAFDILIKLNPKVKKEENVETLGYVK